MRLQPSVDFIVVGLVPAEGQLIFEQTDQGGQPQLADEDCEDEVVFSTLNHSNIEYLPNMPESPTLARALPVLMSPLLLPPDS